MTPIISSFLIHFVGRVWGIGIVVFWGLFYLNVDMVYDIRMYNLFALNIALWTHSVVWMVWELTIKSNCASELQFSHPSYCHPLPSYCHPRRCAFLQQRSSYILIHYFPRLFDFGCSLVIFSVVWSHSLFISEVKNQTFYLENLILISSAKYFYYRTAWP